MTRLGQMIYDDGIEKGLEQGLQIIVETCEELGMTFEQTVEKVRTRFGKDDKSARETVERYWKW